MPILAEAGVDVESNEPELFEVHAIESREHSTSNA
jgi:hypothetical protein